MRPSKELTVKERKFAEVYAVLGNGKESAIRAGYSPKGADVRAHTLLQRDRVKAHIAFIMDKATSEAVLKKEELLEKLSEVIRGWVPKDIENIDGLKAVSILLAHYEKTEALENALKPAETKEDQRLLEERILSLIKE